MENTEKIALRWKPFLKEPFQYENLYILEYADGVVSYIFNHERIKELHWKHRNQFFSYLIQQLVFNEFEEENIVNGYEKEKEVNNYDMKIQLMTYDGKVRTTCDDLPPTNITVLRKIHKYLVDSLEEFIELYHNKLISGMEKVMRNNRETYIVAGAKYRIF